MSNKNFVRCLLIPLGDKQILLPSAVIAEVYPYQEPKPIAKQPDWLLGIFEWRNQQVPLITIEKFLSTIKDSSKKCRSVILYGLESNKSMPFYALTATDIPKPLLIKEEDLTTPSFKPNKNYVFNIMYDGQTIWLPNLTNIENMLRSFPLNS
ncbi:chemotaxis protein CheW [Candidatus Halobeggiatoa sp. HSG11]|nr:chemotaxis protein CheW [Candidatus Halobeggiatoa sp. HSG11]